MTTRPSFRERTAALALALVLGAIVQLPHLIGPRAFVNLDLTFHYHLAREWAASLRGGDPWPRWAFAAGRGLGDPGPLYYSPLYYAAGALLSRVTGNVWVAMQVVEIVAAGALGWFAWALARDHARPAAAAAAIPLAVLAPMACLLQLGFNGFPWACALGPLAALLWAVLRRDALDRPVNVAGAIALGVTILMHTLSGLMGLIALAALSGSAVVTGRTLAGRRVWSPVIVAVMGLLLSAAYLLPAYGYQRLVDAGVWRRNFLPFDAFALPTVTALRFGMRWFAFQWPLPLLSAALAGVSLFAVSRGSRMAERPALAGIAAMLATALLLATEPSYPLWTLDTPLRNFQFPFRLFALFVPLAAVLAAIGLDRARGRRRLAVAALAIASVALGGTIVLKALVHDGRRMDIGEATLAPYNGLDEYRTIASLAAPAGARGYDLAAACAANSARCSAGVRQGRGMRWTVAAPRALRLVLPVRCFPAWSLTIDGRPAPAACDPATALATATVPAGGATIVLAWRMLPLERLGLAISLATLAALVAAALWRRPLSRRA